MGGNAKTAPYNGHAPVFLQGASRGRCSPLQSRVFLHIVEEIFGEALDLPPEEREAFLDETCGDDLYLRQQVKILLFLVHRIG